MQEFSNESMEQPGSTIGALAGILDVTLDGANEGTLVWTGTFEVGVEGALVLEHLFGPMKER